MSFTGSLRTFIHRPFRFHCYHVQQNVEEKKNHNRPFYVLFNFFSVDLQELFHLLEKDSLIKF